MATLARGTTNVEKSETFTTERSNDVSCCAMKNTYGMTDEVVPRLQIWIRNRGLWKYQALKVLIKIQQPRGISSGRQLPLQDLCPAISAHLLMCVQVKCPRKRHSLGCNDPRTCRGSRITLAMKSKEDKNPPFNSFVGHTSTIILSPHVTLLFETPLINDRID